jgi:DNA-binding protein H-NS
MKTLPELLIERTAIEKAIENARKTQRKAAVAQVRELLKLYDISVKEISFPDAMQSASDSKLKTKRRTSNNKINATEKIKSKTKINTKVEPKYRDDAGNTWTGRGKSPRWLMEAESKGHLRNEFLIPQ